MNELRRQRRMAMRGAPERVGVSFARGNIEMRAKPNGTAAGSNFEWNGYATVYDFEFDMWDQNGDPFKEHVEQGAARRSLANPNLDVPFLIGHNDAGIPLARTKSGTMKLSEDTQGVFSHVPSMDGRREEVRALASAVEREDLDEMSLAFVCLRQAWDDDYERRTVLEMDLHRGDVCAVVHGANPATAGAWMSPVEQLAFRRPASIGGPHLLGRERRMPTAPYTVHPGEDNACPQCQSMNDQDAHFCDQCGAKMPGGPKGESAVTGEDQTHQCQSCLSMNATDAKYCDQCGREMAGNRPYIAPGGGYVSDGYGRTAPREHRAKYTADELKDMAAKGQAMKNASGDPSYPIKDADDLDKAVKAVGRGGADHDAIRQHIMARAKALGLSSKIPDSWNADGSIGEEHAAGQPKERRASAAEDMNLASSSDYNAQPMPLTCPKCKAGSPVVPFCAQCGHNFASGATVAVDDATGIPGEETQMGAARKLELMARELELEELASGRR